MMNKFKLFKLGFNKLTRLTGLAGLVGLMGLASCTKLTSDFSYSPSEPVAGEVITFTNNSTGADDYLWNFGDNITGTSSSPSHIYKKPGKYLVTLHVIRNKVEKRSSSQYITVYDTIPALATDSDTIYAFTPVKFYVQRYNPWGKQISYSWSIPANAVVTSAEKDSSAIVCYFTQSDVTSTIYATMHMEGNQPIQLSYDVTPLHKQAASVLYMHNQQAMEQFIYTINSQPVFSTAAITQDATNLFLLNSEQDTLYEHGSHKYDLDAVKNLLGVTIRGFQADRLMSKIYAYGEGLWVFNMTGSPDKQYKYQLDNASVSAIKVDGGGNHVYWATKEGLLTLPLIGTEINHNTHTPDTVNQFDHITRISIRSNLH